MIDFPASPTNGQIFNAPNGVAYQYSATYSSWLAQSAAPGVGPYLPLAGGTLAGPGTLVGTTATFSGAAQALKLGVGMAPSATATSNIWTTGDITMNGAAHMLAGNIYYDAGWKYTAGGATAALVKFAQDTTTAFQLFIAPNNAGAAGATAVPIAAMVADAAGALTFPTQVAHTAALTGTTATFSGTVGVGGAVGSAKFRSSGADSDLLGLFSGTTKGVRITTSASGTTIEGVDNTGVTSFQPLNLNGTTVAAPTPAPASNDTSIATTAWVRANISGGGGSGKLLQTVYNRTGTGGSGTTIIPFDTTIPQITEGDEYMTLAVTPTSATSLLIIDVVWIGSSSAVNNMGVALFKDATASALTAAAATVTAANATVNIKFKYIMVSGSTTATTFRVRAGGGAAGTTSFNSGTTFGFVMCSSMTIQEVTP